MYPGQTTALEQYPNSGMSIPQVDAIRRARAGMQKPLYSAAEEVMGGIKPAMEGGTKPMMEGGSGGGFATKPQFVGNDPNSKFDPNAKFVRKPMMEDPAAKFGRKPMAEQPQRMGAPTGRGVPGVPGPAPRIRGMM